MVTLEKSLLSLTAADLMSQAVVVIPRKCPCARLPICFRRPV